ncbi:MAG: hypothetical protein QHJ73_06990 [Armatimonadota bacterium]|nr:hypothetical protein [Armatimonadota bacterium]
MKGIDAVNDLSSLRLVARLLCGVLVTGVALPHTPVRAGEAPAAAPAVAPETPLPLVGDVVVLDASNDRVVLSAGEKQGIRRGAEFRIVRAGEEVARVSVVEVFLATSRARVISGLPATQLRANDRAELVAMPPAPKHGGWKFPWATVIGAGIVTLVAIGLARDGGARTEPTSGAADVTIR